MRSPAPSPSPSPDRKRRKRRLVTYGSSSSSRFRAAAQPRHPTDLRSPSPSPPNRSSPPPVTRSRSKTARRASDAMATFQANPQALDQLMSLGIDRNDAIACLKACENDANQAAEYFYGGKLDTDRQNNKWDESAWGAPREGGGTSNERSYDNNFHVQAPDALNPTFDGGKSRPPSRVSNRRQDEDNDPDMAQAIAASMQIPGVEHPYAQQETGVTGVTGTRTSPVHSTFAPAVPGKTYDTEQWALTTSTSKAHEIILDPLPIARKRRSGTPAFFKESNLGNVVPGLLTVLHAIPKARNALLLPFYHSIPDFGYDAQWWSGENRIRIARVLNEEFEISDSDMEILEEVQRLIAFLDSTTRAYGSIDGLVDLFNWNWESSDPVGDFLSKWTENAKFFYTNDEDLNLIDVFSSQALKQDRNSEETTSQKIFQSVDLSYPVIGPPTLINALYELFWNDSADGETLIDFSDVICLHIKDRWDYKKQPPLEIPLELYPDRYSSEWKMVARELRVKIETAETEIKDLQEEMQKKTRFTAKTARASVESQKLLETVRDHLSKPFPRVRGSEEKERPDKVVEALNRTIEKLEKKMNELSVSQEEAVKTLEKLKSAYTNPSEPVPEGLRLTKYTLQGIVIDAKNCFVQISSPPEGSIMSEATEAESKWWRCTWGTDGTVWESSNKQTWETVEVAVEEVLETAKAQESSILLIYANANALSATPLPLSHALKAFVDHDNAAFASELGSSSSSKRRRSSGGDLDATTANDSCASSPKRPSTGNGGGGPMSIVASSSPPPSYDASEAQSSGFIVSQDVELPPTQEMRERGGHISPVASAFHLNRIVQEDIYQDQDEEMVDVQHVEHSPDISPFPAATSPGERKGG